MTTTRTLASEIWGLLVPNERPPSIWLAAKVSRLGETDLPSALTRISLILHKHGLIPSSSRGEGDMMTEVVVRDALCPDHNAAMQVRRHTAWCKLKGQTCSNLAKYGEGWVKCKALDQGDAEGEVVPFNPAPDQKEPYPPGGKLPPDSGRSLPQLNRELQRTVKDEPKPKGAAWWDIQQPTEEPKQKGGLSGLLKILGPAALTGLAVWKMKEREIEMMKRPPNTSSDAYTIVKNVLKSYGLTYAYDTDTLTFKLQRGTITLDRKGGARMEGKGKRMRATKANLLDKVFEFAGLIK